MFERYTENARRVIFIGRYEASASASLEIITVHLLLGVSREGSGIVVTLLQSGEALDRLRADLLGSQPESRVHVSASIDLPLSMDSKRVLAYAAEESEQLRHRHIDVIHLLLGLGRDTTASIFLQRYEITRERVMNRVISTEPPERAANNRAYARLHALVNRLPPDLVEPAELALRKLLAPAADN